MNSEIIGIALAVFLILVVAVIVVVKMRSYQSDDPTRAKVVAAVDNLIQVLKKTGGVFAPYQAQQKQWCRHTTRSGLWIERVPSSRSKCCAPERPFIPRCGTLIITHLRRITRRCVNKKSHQTLCGPANHWLYIAPPPPSCLSR